MSLVSGSKQHQGVKRTSMLHHVKDEHSCHPSTFLVWEATDIPQCVGSSFFNCQAAISKAQGLIGSLEEGDILQLQFHHSVGIPVAQYLHTMAFDTIAGCHRCGPSWSNLSIWQVATSKKKACQSAWVLWNISLDFANTLQEYHFTSRRRAVSALALQTYSRKMFGTQKPTTSVSDGVWNCRLGWNKLIYN